MGFRRPKLVTVLPLFCLGLHAWGTPLAGQAAAVQKLSLDTYLDMETVSDPQISPDGTRIVYTRGWIDRVNDRRESSLWVMDADGSRNRHLVEGSGARWSPDGTRILFTAPGEPGGTQIFVRWMDAEGATTQITRIENAPSNPRWSPDGRWIAFTSRVDDRADFAGVDRSASVTAYQSASGFVNYLTPTAAVVMGGLTLAKGARGSVDDDNIAAGGNRILRRLDIDGDRDRKAGRDEGRAGIERPRQIVGDDRGLQRHAISSVLTAWQATRWPGLASFQTGITLLQTSIAIGQRV